MSPLALNAPAVLALQRTAGNAATAYAVLQRQRAPAVRPAGPAQQREFLDDIARFLEASEAYFQQARVNAATLERVLTGWERMATDSERLATALGDQARRGRVRRAYRAALRVLLPRAAAAMNTSAELLYLRYRYQGPRLIPEWGGTEVAGITTRLPVGANPDPITGEVTMTISGAQVIFLPDGRQRRNGARTNINWDFNNAIQFRTRGGRIGSHVGPGTPVARIQTLYGPNLTAASRSGYGRGTTATDVAAGDTSLGFHEGSHGQDYLSFIATHPFPQFAGRDGMTTRQFRRVINDYAAACRRYSNEIERFSEQQTDCVGITIEDYYRAQRRRSPVRCPP